LEFDSITEWLSSVEWSSLVNEPCLIQTIVAVVEDNVSLVGVRLSVNIKTFSSIVLDVSS
jgi:hypothetical protein